MLKIDSKKFIIAFAKTGMTTTEFRDKSGVGRNTISKALNGDISVRPGIVGKLAKALYVEITDIIVNG